MAMGMYYHVEYTIQETTCPQSAEAADKCTPMECEFAVSHCQISTSQTSAKGQSDRLFQLPGTVM